MTSHRRRPESLHPLPAVVIMGVSGCGKSTLAARLGHLPGTCLIEGDDYHDIANIARMHSGLPLSDADRQGWLERLTQAMQDALRQGTRPVLACSALKRAYRQQLRTATPQLGFIYLALTPEEARRRLAARLGHFMPPSLIASQFQDLEPPDEKQEPRTLTLDATLPATVLCEKARHWLGWDGAASGPDSPCT
jgi:gluconokinase